MDRNINVQKTIISSADSKSPSGVNEIQYSTKEQARKFRITSWQAIENMLGFLNDQRIVNQKAHSSSNTSFFLQL